MERDIPVPTKDSTDEYQYYVIVEFSLTTVFNKCGFDPVKDLSQKPSGRKTIPKLEKALEMIDLVPEEWLYKHLVQQHIEKMI